MIPSIFQFDGAMVRTFAEANGDLCREAAKQGVHFFRMRHH